MSEVPDMPDLPPPGNSPHAWIHEHLAAYLAGGLSTQERQWFDAHINTCPDCFDAFTEARDADRAMLRAFAPLIPDENLEQRVTDHVRENTMKRMLFPIVRRAGYAAAACIALAATGVLANYLLHSDRFLNNPLSLRLVAEADRTAPALNGTIERLHDKAVARAWGEQASWSDVKPAAAQALVDSLNKAQLDAQDARAQIALGESGGRGAGGGVTNSAVASKDIEVGKLREDKDSRAASLVDDARKLYDTQQFQEARDLVRQAEIIDPQNEKAALMGRLLASKDTDRDYEAIMHRSGIQVLRDSLDGAEHNIPSRSSDLAKAEKSLTEANPIDRVPLLGDMPYLGGKFKESDGGIGNTALAFGDEAQKKQLASAGELRFERNRPQGGNEDFYFSMKDAEDGKLKMLEGKEGVLKSGGDTSYGIKGTLAFSSGAGDKVSAPQINLQTLSDQEKSFAGGGGGGFGGGGGGGGGFFNAGDPQIAAAGSPGQQPGGQATAAPSSTPTSGIQSSSLVSSGQGTTTLAGSNTYSGGMTVTAGRAVPVAPGEIKNVDGGMTVLTGGALTLKSGNGQDLLAAATPPAGQPMQPSTPRPGVTAPATQPSAPAPSPEVAAGLKIIRNGTLEFEVRSFDDTYRTISRIVTEERGFIASTSSDKLANGKVRGVITVRVPPERLEYFLQGIRALGDLKAQKISANDVTKDYYDIASELRGLTTMEGRLIDLIKNGKGEVKDLIEAEKQLGETRTKIERLKGQIAYYDNLVSLCTITITAFEKDIQSPTAASEQEIVTLNVETEEVEAKYQAARKIFEDAKARIVESQLKNTDAEHVAAHLVADVPPEQADFVSNQLKQLGKVSSFNRDRKQTTTGGTGTPSVEVQRKDTRITVDLFNLANMAPRETTVLRIAVANVENAYTDILARIRRETAAPAQPAADQNATTRTAGRVITSALTGQQPEQMTADLRAEIRTENADALIAAIRNSGEVLAGSLATNPDNASTTAAKRGIQIRLENIASVQPRQANNIIIAVPNVEAAYSQLLGTIRRQPAPATQPAGRVAATNRVVASALNGQRPEEMNGEIRAEITADIAEQIATQVRAGGEVLFSDTVDTPDHVVATASKRGLYVRFVNVAAVNAREAQGIRAVAPDVTAAYKSLLTALQSLADKAPADGIAPRGGGVRIITSSLNGSDRRTMTARFTFDAPRSAEGDITKAFEAAGIDFLSRTIVRSNDTANTLDTKIRYQIDEIRAAESLEPRRTFVLTRELKDVDKALNEIRMSLPPNMPPLEFNVSRSANGAVTARGTFDLPLDQSVTVRTILSRLGGIEKDNQTIPNNNAPDTRLARERVEATLFSPPDAGPIVNPDQGLGNTVRAALKTASGVLFYSLYLVIVGTLFILPFALILWPIWRILKRKKATATA